MMTFVYGIANPGVGDGSKTLGIGVWVASAVLHLLTGVGIGRMWAAVLPLVAVLLAIPAGYPNVAHEGPPIWAGLLIFLFVPGVVLMTIGVVARALAARRGSARRPPRVPAEAGPGRA